MRQSSACKAGSRCSKKNPPARRYRWSQRRREAGRKPSSVPGCPGDDHSSMTPVTRGLQQPTRELRAGHPQTLPYLVLLQVGFSKPAMSPLPLVSSYLTLPPLPWAYHGDWSLRHFPWDCPRWGLPRPRPVELGLSSGGLKGGRRSSGLSAILWGKTLRCGEPSPLPAILPRGGVLVNGPVSRGVGQMVFFPGQLG